MCVPLLILSGYDSPEHESEQVNMKISGAMKLLDGHWLPKLVKEICYC